MSGLRIFVELEERRHIGPFLLALAEGPSGRLGKIVTNRVITMHLYLDSQYVHSCIPGQNQFFSSTVLFKVTNSKNLLTTKKSQKGFDGQHCSCSVTTTLPHMSSVGCFDRTGSILFIPRTQIPDALSTITGKPGFTSARPPNAQWKKEAKKDYFACLLAQQSQ